MASRVSDPSLIVAGLLAAGVLTAPAFAGPPFRTDDPVPTDFQHFEIYLFSEGEKATDGWAGTLPGLEVNYGALPNLQLSVPTLRSIGTRTCKALINLDHKNQHHPDKAHAHVRRVGVNGNKSSMLA
jgi:hypothetical protein